MGPLKEAGWIEELGGVDRLRTAGGTGTTPDSLHREPAKRSELTGVLPGATSLGRRREPTSGDATGARRQRVFDTF